MTVPNEQRIDELLAGLALDDLSVEERQELQGARGDAGSNWFSEALEFELAAAATAIACLPEVEPMPFAVQERVFASLPGEAASAPPAPPRPRLRAVEQPHRATGSWARVAWPLLAAAALLVGWLLPRPETAPVAMRADVAMAEFLKNAPSDLLRESWAAGPSPLSGERAGGEILWSDEAQTGFMVFDGLPENIPSERQYQLWIFDGTRAGSPVDGGVFDVRYDGSTRCVVPIDSKLEVGNGAGFAVTVEKPAGVVVSEREHIVRVYGL